MLNFLKSLFINLIFISIYYLFYKYLGFELTVVIGIGNIVAFLTLPNIKKKPVNYKPVYRSSSKPKIRY